MPGRTQAGGEGCGDEDCRHGPGSPYELVYGNDPACLEELHRLMVQRLGYEPAAVYQIGAAVAANSGPRVVGAAFTRKKEG